MNMSRVGVFIGVVLAVVISGLYLSFVVTRPVVENNVITIMEQKRIPTLVTADANPGEGITGFYYFVVIAHQANTAMFLGNNISHTGTNATIFEYLDSTNGSATGETPYNTAFDIVVKYGVTDNDGTNYTNGTFNSAYYWVYGWDSGTTPAIEELNMTKYIIGQNSTYLWFNAVANNGGAGYTIPIGQTHYFYANYTVQRNNS